MVKRIAQKNQKQLNDTWKFLRLPVPHQQKKDPGGAQVLYRRSYANIEA
jgi:hypothetical protein